MQDTFGQDKKLFTVNEVAALLKVSGQTIKNYIYQGKLRSLKTPGGHHRILESELSKKFTVNEACMPEGGTEENAANEKLEDFINAGTVMIQAVIRTIEGKEGAVYHGHATRVSKLSRMMGAALSMQGNRLNCLEMAALLHDIGKLNVDDTILGKSTKLTAAEYEKIKKHPQFGAEIVKDVDYLQTFAPVIRHHHEWYNGKGYPDGLRGEHIPLDAQIVGLAEAYDVISNKNKLVKKQDYRERSLAELKKVENIQFPPQLISTLCSVIFLP